MITESKYFQALKLIWGLEMASTGLLVKHFGWSFVLAGQIMDRMVEEGLVSPLLIEEPRKVFMEKLNQRLLDSENNRIQ